MVIALHQIPDRDDVAKGVDYPEADGKPMAEGDIQCEYLTYVRQALKAFFQNREDVYVAGNLFIYYERGNPEAVVAPDTFVIFGVSSDNRRSYKVWEEGYHVPSFVLEITSKSTYAQDLGAKRGIYSFLGVNEYVLYDPTSDYLEPPLQGWQLQDGNYYPMESIPLEAGFKISSSVLGLELHLEAGQLQLYDPGTGEPLRNYAQERQKRQEIESELQQKDAQLQALAQQLATLQAQLGQNQNQ